MENPHADTDATPCYPATEVSEVTSVTPKPVSLEVTPPQGESFKTIKPNTWFQSMTNHFSINTTFLCVDQPL